MRTFSVKNFERFQHYRDRSPPWIKLYNELLDDYEFGLLPDASKMHIIAIWLLASRSENKIPYDAAWVSRRINANSKVDLDLLAANGFIVVDQELNNSERSASTAQAECLSREEGQVQDIGKRKEEFRAASPSNDDFENFRKVYPRRKGNYAWKAAERKFSSLVKTGVDPKIIIAAAVRMSDTLRSKIGTEYIPMPASWLNSEDFLHVAVAAFEPEVIDWDAACKQWITIKRWPRGIGNDPDSPACRAPPQVLEKYGLKTDFLSSEHQGAIQ